MLNDNSNQSPPPQRKSRGWAFLAILMMSCLALSLLMNVATFLTSVEPPYSADGKEVLIQDNDSKHKIAVIDVAGLISSYFGGSSGTSGMPDTIARQLERAADDPDVRAIILRIESPGGEVLASDKIFNEVREFQKETGKPVVASMGGLAASGGYYVAAPCQWIVAHELTITGSIGVIMQGWNYRSLMDKAGVKPMVFKSGKFKDMLSPEKSPEDILPEEREMAQTMIDEVFERFKKVVREGRNLESRNEPEGGKTLVKNWEEFADGRILSGIQAEKLGFVDELGDFDTAVERTHEIAGIPDANLIQYWEPLDISQLFGFLGKSEKKTLKIDLGINLPKLRSGCLYFLSPLLLH